MDMASIDGIIDRHGGEQSSLIQIMLDIQGELNWLPGEAIGRVSERLQIPSTRIRHIATFYKAFSLVPKGRHLVHVCMGTACHVRDAPRVLSMLEDRLGIRAGQTDSELSYSLETVNCLGCCALGPVVDVDGKIHGNVSAANAAAVVEGTE